MKRSGLLILCLLLSLQVARSDEQALCDAFVPAWLTLKSIKSWSITQSKKYYPKQCGNGELGDAYRHVLASAVSRKLVGRAMASSAGWVNELLRDVKQTNTVRDRVMDLHNNRLGRVAYYSELYHQNLDSMAQRVHVFIENEEHQSLLNWGAQMPTKKEAMAVHRHSAQRNQYFIYE